MKVQYHYQLGSSRRRKFFSLSGAQVYDFVPTTPELTFHCVHQADLLHRIVLSLHTHTHTLTHIYCHNNERMNVCVVRSIVMQN
jgi:hypothetical protein